MPKSYIKPLFLTLVWFIGVFSNLYAIHKAPSSPLITIPQEKKHICLTMIVKNEAAIIERCLNNVKDIVDCISISDTGSTDQTVEIIEAFMKKHDIPGKVHRHTWKNFGHNRSLSVKAAQEMLKELHYSLPHTHLLLIDADMILKVDPSFNKNELIHDSYLMVQKSSEHTYYNTRLVKASLPWECVGVTHEYWSCPVPNKIEKIFSLSIDDQGDGGCKADKFERDIKLLTQGLQEDPDNARYMFYLAQSYQNTQQYGNAIRWYKARIEKEDWKEEVWYSKYMIGECYQALGFWDQALHWYLDAYQYIPERAESLLSIARYYRLNGQNDLAYVFAKQGSRIPFPKDQILFVSHPVYHYRFDEELSIAAYYTPFKEEGFAATNRLVLKTGIPQWVKDNAIQNLLFYVPNLKNSKVQSITFDYPLIKEGSSLYYQPMNPSIQKTNDGYEVICRTVNFTQEKGTHYQSLDPTDETIRTRNYLLHYDRDFKLIAQKEIIETLPREKYASKIVGLEDPRLFKIENDSYFFCTTFDTQPNKIEQSLAKLKSTSSTSTVEVEKLIPLKIDSAHDCEKNWLPFVKEDIVHAIYGYSPFTIYKVNLMDGSCDTVLEQQMDYDFSRFRGSAAPIAFDKGYLMIVHEVIFKEGRHYQHRFVYLDQDLNIKKVSKPFTFLHDGVEYCCGMTIDHANKQLIIPIGYEDKQAFLVFADLNTVRSMLETLP